MARTRRALDRVVAGPQPALVVAHVGTIRAAMLALGRQSPAAADVAHAQIVGTSVADPPCVRSWSDPVRQFSAPHLAALAVLAVSAPAAVLVARRCSERTTTIVYRALAVLIICGWVGEYVADVALGIWSVQYDLPLQLTDLITVTAAVALWTRSQRAAEFAYLWALSASLQATITPDLSWNYPSAFYFTYFDYHIVAVVAGIGLVFGCGLYPRPGAPRRVFAATLCWLAVAGAGDIITGGNYMYLRAKPVDGSLISGFGPWPWYIAGTAALGFAMLLALQGIAALARRWTAPAPAATASGAAASSSAAAQP